TAPVAQQSKGTVSVPAPARLKQRRQQGCLLQNFFHGIFMQEVEDISQRKAVLLGECDVQSVINSAGLQCKIKGDAETLAQCQSPGFIDARSKRRMHHKLHASAFVKETFGN